jgi:shikimate kinase
VRTRHGRHRPLLNDTDPQQKLAELMRDREALYAEIADLTVSTDGRRVQLVAEEIHRELHRARGSQASYNPGSPSE